MIIRIYTLQHDGTIPPDIIEGGYLPIKIDAQSPQDWQCVGFSTQTAAEIQLETYEALLNYIDENHLELCDPENNRKTSDEYAQIIWNKWLRLLDTK